MSTAAATPPFAKLKEFLETTPPGSFVRLDASNFTVDKSNRAVYGFVMSLVPVVLYCRTPQTCGESRVFQPDAKSVALGWNEGDAFLAFTCRNCQTGKKTFAIRFGVPVESTNARTAYKFGEIPQFGPPLSAKLLQVAGADGDVLKKGRQSENQSLGVGAFAYYRRVVERQKSKLIDELKNAVERLGGSEGALQTLEAAKSESQFSKAIKSIADVIPKELYVSNQNPLTVLHGPLSVGLHELSDAECLEKAHHVRVVLSALLERVQLVTEEKAELDAAVKALLQPTSSGESK